MSVELVLCFTEEITDFGDGWVVGWTETAIWKQVRKFWNYFWERIFSRRKYFFPNFWHFSIFFFQILSPTAELAVLVVWRLVEILDSEWLERALLFNKMASLKTTFWSRRRTQRTATARRNNVAARIMSSKKKTMSVYLLQMKLLLTIR